MTERTATEQIVARDMAQLRKESEALRLLDRLRKTIEISQTVEGETARVEEMRADFTMDSVAIVAPLINEPIDERQAFYAGWHARTTQEAAGYGNAGHAWAKYVCQRIEAPAIKRDGNLGICICQNCGMTITVSDSAEAGLVRGGAMVEFYHCANRNHCEFARALRSQMSPADVQAQHLGEFGK